MENNIEYPTYNTDDFERACDILIGEDEIANKLDFNLSTYYSKEF